MEQLASIFSFLAAHWLEIVGAIVMILNGIIAIGLLIPGNFPESVLVPIVNFLTKISKK